MFVDTNIFSFTQKFEINWEKIRDEFLNLDPKILDFHRQSVPYEEYAEKLLKENGWVPSWQVGSDKPNFKWLTYGLCFKGLFPKEAELKFPFTANLLSSLNGIEMCGFSLMKPYSFIAPHSHLNVNEDILSYHLGLESVRRKNYLFINGFSEEEQNGKSIIFSSMNEHFAINMSRSNRVILYMEFNKNKIS